MAVVGGQTDIGINPTSAFVPAIAHGDVYVLGYVGDEAPRQVGVAFISSKTQTSGPISFSAFCVLPVTALRIIPMLSRRRTERVATDRTWSMCSRSFRNTWARRRSRSRGPSYMNERSVHDCRDDKKHGNCGGVIKAPGLSLRERARPIRYEIERNGAFRLVKLNHCHPVILANSKSSSGSSSPRQANSWNF